MIERVGYLSMHTSPLVQPGVGDAGGMNVYIDELASTMTTRGIQVDVYTRRDSNGLPDVVEAGGGYRVHHLDAGPHHTVPIRSLARYVSDFASQVEERFDGIPPQIIHSHYWLSGWAALVIKRRTEIPIANSFHTLGRVKDLTRRADEPPEPLLRIAAEHEVIEEADCVVASTPLEAEDLMVHYRADPTRLCMSPPGVDHRLFSPGDQVVARADLGLDDRPTVLFVGRVQPLKGIDVALAAVSILKEHLPEVQLLVVGGPSGASGHSEMARLHGMASAMGNAVRFVEPVPHADLVSFYRAADVLILPSRSESFGLVAAEAQACGLPVVAARTGGLAHVVADGESGILVDSWDPHPYADALWRVITDAELASRLRAGALEWSERFSWDATASRFIELYVGALSRVG